ncbi:MAG: iron chaperone, partial [Bacteroidia bacterium]
MKKAAKSKIPKDVDSYLAKVPPKDRAALEKIRKTIKSAAPKAEEVISYQIPGYKYHGPVVFFAAFPNHLSFFAVGKKLLHDLADELKPFEIKGTTIHFTASNPLPAKLVKKIVK